LLDEVIIIIIIIINDTDTTISWSDGTTWVKYTDPMSGVWQGWFNPIEVLYEVCVLKSRSHTFHPIDDTHVGLCLSSDWQSITSCSASYRSADTPRSTSSRARAI
jgi:hypothetical protein